MSQPKTDFSNAERLGRTLNILVSNLLDQLSNGAQTPANMIAAGKIYELADTPSGADQWYRRAMNADPDAHEARARLALLQIKFGRTEDALKTAVELSTIAPKFTLLALDNEKTSAPTVLGDALFAQGEHQKALEAYQQALDVEPQDQRAGGQTVRLLLEAGRVEEARETASNVRLGENREALTAVLRLVGNDDAALPAITGIRFGALAYRDAV